MSGVLERPLSVYFSPKELAKMARREYQDPPLQKTKGENARWFIRYRARVVGPEGVRRIQTREYFGHVAQTPLKAAQRARYEKLKEINEQLFQVGSQCTLSEYYLAYNKTHLPTLGKGTQCKYRIHMQNHILPAFGDKKLCEIDTLTIQDFLNGKDPALSWWTRNDLRNIISSLFSKAQDYGYWPKDKQNPAEPTSCGRRVNKRKKIILSDQQVLQLIHELPWFLQLIVRIADGAGLRVSEVLGLTWAAVDLNTGWVSISQRWCRGDLSVPKNESSKRSMPLGDIAPDLRVWWEECGKPAGGVFLFEKRPGEPWDDRDLNQHLLRKAAKRLGIYFDGFGFHTFRRGQITGMQQVGASSIETSKMAGHSRPQMTAEYTVMERSRREDLVRARQQRFQKVS